MTEQSATAPSGIRCPQCLDTITWDERTVYSLDGDIPMPVDLDAITEPVKQEDALHNAFVRCPNPSNDVGFDHYLPVGYVRYLPPLVIGLVGIHETGKSTLLATMVDAIDRGGLAPYGLDCRPLNQAMHVEFRRARVDRLLASGGTLPATAAAAEAVRFTDAYLVTDRAGATRPIAFFDVGGESLARNDGPATRFLRAVGALLFVVDPVRLDQDLDRTGMPSSAGDGAYNAVLSRIAPSTAPRLDLPAAVVLVKADTLRFDPVVRSWLMHEDPAPGVIQADVIRAESRDVYAYLHKRGAGAWLSPFDRCWRCTLHVVTATGGNPAPDLTYPRGLRPRRVLAPLVSILAMSGVIGGAQAESVGR